MMPSTLSAVRSLIFFLFNACSLAAASAGDEGAGAGAITRKQGDMPLVPAKSYAAVVDAGSTGSRAYFTEVTVNPSDGTRSLRVVPARKVTPGLSTFQSHPSDAAAYLAPALHSVLPLLPHTEGEEAVRVALHVRGTAGMRLLPEPDQEAIWDQLYKDLSSDAAISSLFDVRREHMGTISGKSEAYYAILASNFVAGNIDGNLKSLPGSRLVGAVDMGGSSTQLVVPREVGEGETVGEHHFWSHSWLEFGAEKFQERMWGHFRDRLASRRSVLKQKDQGQCTIPSPDSPAGGGGEVCPAVPVLLNPCIFKGHVEPMEFDYHDDGDEDTDLVLVEGTGDADECTKLIHSILWPTDEPTSDTATATITTATTTDDAVTPASSCRERGRCPIDNVHVPRIQDLHFYGMSAYFYALDSVRELGPVELLHWPRPSVEELEAAVGAFCSMEWEEDGKHLKSRHRYTSDARLQFRCLEANYILTLLRHGFGFEGHHRNLTLALEVEGTEVEWTLGYALANIPPFGQ